MCLNLSEFSTQLGTEDHFTGLHILRPYPYSKYWSRAI